MIQTVLLFILGLILICLGGDRLVDAAVAIAKKLGIPEIVVGATIVSLGTTLPEILEIIAESYYYLGEKEKSKEFYYQAYYISKATGNCRETNDVKDNAKKYLGIDFSF